MFFCDFWEIFKSTFFTETLQVTISGSSGRSLKAYQKNINSGNNSAFNANAERIFVFCDNFWKLPSWIASQNLGRFLREMSVVEFYYGMKP